MVLLSRQRMWLGRDEGVRGGEAITRTFRQRGVALAESFTAARQHGGGLGHRSAQRAGAL